MTTVFAPTDLDISEAHSFARECQIAAGLFADGGDVAAILAAIHTALRTVPDALAAAYMHRALLALIGLARAITRWSIASKESGFDSRRPLDAGLAFMLANHAQPLQARALAATAGISEARLSELFGSTGFSFFEHLQAIRVTHAIALLADTTDSIAAVARASGYRQPSHFVRQFRSIAKMTPTRFRRLCKVSRVTVQHPYAIPDNFSANSFIPRV